MLSSGDLSGVFREITFEAIAQECHQNIGVPLEVSPIEVIAQSLIYVEYPPTKVVAERYPA